MTDLDAGPATRVRFWGVIGLLSQLLFLAAWLIAAAWQGPHYSPIAHSISDMYAEGAPAAAVVIVCLTVSGIGTVLFALLGLRPALRRGGAIATTGCVLIALSILGLGDVLTPFERLGCRIADPGCTADGQLANVGGKLDSYLSTITLVLLAAAFFQLAEGMRRLPRWAGYAWPARIVGIAIAVLLACLGLSGDSGFGGLAERLLAAVAALGVAGLAIGVIRFTAPAASS